MPPWSEPITVEGSGDDVIGFNVPDNEPAVLTIAYAGSSNFSVLTYDASGNRLDLLVNEIGTYNGRLPINFLAGEEVAEVEITASGPWTIIAEPVSTAEVFTGAQLAGGGDDVILIDGASTRLAVTHDGSSNFSILAFGSGRDLLINEIGAYSGTVRLDAGAVVLVITADGNWTLESQ